MKFLVAILLVVASVHANSLHYYGWTPGKETLFKFESQVLLGIPEIKESHFAGVKLSSKVRVQSYSDYSLRVKIEEPRFLTLNGEVKVSETGRLLEQQSSESARTEAMPESFQKYLEQPFLVYLKSGVVQSFLVAKQEPVSVTNLKKSVLAQIQLDIAGTRRSQIEANHIQLPLSEEGQVSEHISYFTTSEESVQGECLTEYNIHKLPQWKVNEMEEAWTMEELKIKGVQQSSSSQASNTLLGKKQCQEKPYYLITRSINFDQCKNRPVFQKWTNFNSECDVASGTCESAMAHTSTTTTVICGELNDFVVRKAVHSDERQIAPLGLNTEEKTVSLTKIHMELLGMESITERLPVATDVKTIESLVYSYPEQTSSQESTIEQEVMSETEAILGIRPVLPQPGLVEAPPALIPVSITKEQIIPQVHEQMKKMAREVYESPESCSSKSDLAGTLNQVSMYMRHLSLTELEELEAKITEESELTIQKIFYETLSLVGTNPSTMLIIKRVESGSLPTPLLSTMIAKSLRSVRYPTKALLGELVKLAKSQTVLSNKQIFTTTILNLSNLFYRAYVNPTTMITTFPTKVFGVFGTKDTPVLVNQYIPFLIEKLESQPAEHIRLSVISSLGKLGHIKALKPLLMVTGAARPVAIFSMKRIAKINPVEVRPILMTIITNPVESPDVRIAAVSVLPFAHPTVSELQTIAVSSWYEPSKQVSSFIYSTLKSLSSTDVPTLKTVGINARTVLPMMKIESVGIHRSHNINLSTVVEYLRTIVSEQLVLVNSKESLIPRHASIKTKFYGPSMTEIPSITFSAYTLGMDTLLEKGLQYMGYPTQTTSSVRSQLNQITQELNLKVREFQQPQAFIQQSVFGTESASLVDSELVLETIEEISRRLEKDLSFEFSHVSVDQMSETTDYGMSATGLPLIMITSSPNLFAIRGSVQTESVEGKLLPKITAKVIPVVNGKLQSTIGVIFPVTEELIGTGVEMSLHSSAPVEIESIVSKGELQLALRTPHEVVRSGHETMILHGFVLPYTVKKNLRNVQPVSQSPTLKKIVSASNRSPIVVPVGESLGLAGRITLESDAKFNDIFSYYEKIRQHSVSSFLNIGFLPSSLRYAAAKLEYIPSRSEIKEVNVIVKLTSTLANNPLSAGPINEAEIKKYATIKEIISTLPKNPTTFASVVEITASAKSKVHTKTVKTAVFIGKHSKNVSGQNKIQTLAAIEVLPTTGPTYTVRYEGSIVLPTLLHKWNIEGLLQEPIKASFVGDVILGRQIVGEELKFHLSTVMTKTEELKKSVIKSPEYQRCSAELQKGKTLSPLCVIVRQQAASMDKVEIAIEVPRIISRSPVVSLLGDLIKALSLGQIEYGVSELTTLGQQDQIKFEVVADRVSEIAQVRILTPTTTMKIGNIRLFGMTKSLLPLSIFNQVLDVLPMKLSGSEIPAACHVGPKTVTTFDNKTLSYRINDCEHVLVVDASKTLPIAVLTRTIPEEKKEVTILSGVVEVVLTPVSSGMDVKINGGHHSVAPGASHTEKSSTGSVLAYIKRHMDNVYMVSIPSQSLTVMTDGISVEVVAPQLLKSRAAGLCGDMNGETSADLKTPGMCIMKPKLAALSYMLNKSGSKSGVPACSGIPAEVREEFMRESRKCTQEEIIPTPVLKLHETISASIRPTTRSHLLEETRFTVCISRQMLKVCSGELRPLSLIPRPVSFVCLSRPSAMAASLVERALAGEPLNQELGQLPTAFVKNVQEPVSCQ